MNDSKRNYNSLVLFLTAAFIIFLITRSRTEQYSIDQRQIVSAKILGIAK